MMKQSNKEPQARLRYLLTQLQQYDPDAECGCSIKDISERSGIPISILRSDFYQLNNSKHLPYCMNAVKTEGLEQEYEDFASQQDTAEVKRLFEKGRFDELLFYMISADEELLPLYLSKEAQSMLDEFLQSTGYHDRVSERDLDLATLPLKHAVTDTASETYQYLLTLKEQIAKHSTFQFTYRGKGDKLRSVTIEPLRVIHDAASNLFYLVTIEKNRLAFYRLDRIIGTGIQFQKTEKPIKDLSPLNKLPLIWGMENGKQWHVKLKIKDELNGKIYQKARRDLSAHLGRGNTLTEYQGYMIFEGELCSMQSFLSWVRQYGSSMVILEPEYAVKRMIDSAKARLEQYQKN